jgi:hypothetical protein
MRSDDIGFSLFRWQFHYGEPELLDSPHHRTELVQIHGLRNVTVGVEVVGLENILFGA